MPDLRHRSEPIAVAVAGVAGSGKSTLGRALAASLGLPLIDLDAVTTPLLETLAEEVFGEHWLASPHTRAIRDGRYAALRAVAADVVETAGGVVLVAPFTTELAGGAEWQQLQDAVAPTPLRVVHLAGDPALFTARRAARGAARDEHRPNVAPVAPTIPVIRIDAELTTPQQLDRLLIALGVRRDVDADAELFTRTFDAVLFDLDGTLVDSTASVVRSWRRWSEHYGVSAQALHENHGQPARTLISRLLPPDQHAEGLARITQLEMTDAVDLLPVRGARELFDSIPAERRAIVTSGSTALATARLRAAGFTPPAVFVTADDVTHGKPHPEPFLTAAARLGVAPERCLVVEDAAAGVAAARAAGCHVLALTGTVAAEELHADLVLDGLDGVAADLTADGLRLRPAS